MGGQGLWRRGVWERRDRMAAPIGDTTVFGRGKVPEDGLESPVVDVSGVGSKLTEFDGGVVDVNTDCNHSPNEFTNSLAIVEMLTGQGLSFCVGGREFGTVQLFDKRIVGRDWKTWRFFHGRPTSRVQDLPNVLAAMDGDVRTVLVNVDAVVVPEDALSFHRFKKLSIKIVTEPCIEGGVRSTDGKIIDLSEEEDGGAVNVGSIQTRRVCCRDKTMFVKDGLNVTVPLPRSLRMAL